MTSVDLSRNRISSLAAGTWDFLPNLVDLDMSYNELLELDEHMFHRNFELRSLNFSNNDLRVVSCSFSQLVNLRSLDLSSNRLPTFDQAIFEPIIITGSPLVALDISNNHFDCDCDVLWLKEVERKASLNVKETISGKAGHAKSVKCELPAIAGNGSRRFALTALLENNRHPLFEIIERNFCGMYLLLELFHCFEAHATVLTNILSIYTLYYNIYLIV